MASFTVLSAKQEIGHLAFRLQHWPGVLWDWHLERHRSSHSVFTFAQHYSVWVCLKLNKNNETKWELKVYMFQSEMKENEGKKSTVLSWESKSGNWKQKLGLKQGVLSPDKLGGVIMQEKKMQFKNLKSQA